MARKLKNFDRYGSRTSAVKSDMDKPSPVPMKRLDKRLDEDVSEIGAKTKQGMSDAGSFSAAFRAARKDPNSKGTFTWRGTSYTTKMASDKPAASAPKPTAKREVAGPTPTSGFGKSKTPEFMNKPATTTPVKPTATRSNAASRPASSGLSSAQYTAAVKSGVIPSNASAEDRANLRGTIGATRAAKVNPIKNAPKPKSASMYTDPSRKAMTDEYMKSIGKKKGGSVKKYAKGGSIDGCAVRGKTKA